MVAMCLAILYAFKAIVSAEELRAGKPILPAARWFAFCLAWPGMKPHLFAKTDVATSSKQILEARRRLRCGLLFILAGSGCLAAAQTKPFNDSSFAVTALLLCGLSCVLHFGVFAVLSAGWRLAGVPVRPLFRTPLCARSLTEFWSRRWNLAFSEMIQLTVYRPIAGMTNRNVARFAAFLVSGLLHELAISVPVRAGYGLPLAYFALHGMLVARERDDGNGHVPHRVWTLAWLALPILLVFHLPFLRGVVWPLAGIR